MGRRSKQTFLHKRHTEREQGSENIFTVTNVRETQVKTALRHPLTLVRMATAK